MHPNEHASPGQIARATELGVPIEPTTTLTQFYEMLGDAETRAVADRDRARRAEQLARLVVHHARVEGRDKGMQNGRGKPRAVVAMDWLDPASTYDRPRLRVFPRVIEAAAAIGHHGDTISAAIRRCRRAGGYSWTYLDRTTPALLDQEARTFIKTPAGRAQLIAIDPTAAERLAKTAAAPWTPPAQQARKRHKRPADDGTGWLFPVAPYLLATSPAVGMSA